MKKTVVFLSMIAVLGLMANSCISGIVKEDVIEQPTPQPNNQKKYFLRFTLNSIAGTTPFVLDWSNYNRVGYLLDNEQGDNIFPYKEITIPKESGYEDVLLVDSVVTDYENGQGYAYAPYDATITGTELTGTLNANQAQLVSSSKTMDNALNNNMKLVSTSTTFKIDQGSCQLGLRNIFSIIQLTIEDVTSLLSFRSIQSVKLYIADNNDIRTPVNSSLLAGQYKIDLKNINTVAQFTSPSYTITATPTTGSSTQISSRPVFYFVVNPFTLKANETLAVTIVTNRDDVIYSSFNISPVRNNIYSITASVTEENTYVESTSEEYVNSYSNCYVVSKKGKYIFPADKTINGQTLTGGVTVDWLWAMKEGGGKFDISELINPSNLVYDGSRITFQVGNENPFIPIKYGNVILALKDASGNIVRTWHIWITDEPKDYLHETKVFLDRNIGALAAETESSPVDNFGFVYQWGRKDPFFGGDGITNETASGTTGPMSIANANTIFNIGITNWPQPSTTTRTADYARQNPMIFICNNTSPAAGQADWLSGSNDPNRWSESDKSDNDPCPFGYRVPGKTDVQTLHNAAFANNAWMYFRNIGHWQWEYFYYFDPTYTNTTTLWPTAGMRQGRNLYLGNAGAQLINSGTAELRGQCYYWTSSPAKAGGTIIPGGSYRIFTSGNMLYSEDDYGDNADAYPVRCLKE